MLTCTDLMEVMWWSQKCGEDVDEVMEYHSPVSWRCAIDGKIDGGSYPGCRAAVAAAKHIVGRGARWQDLITILPDDSLLSACSLLWEKRIHRLPIVHPLSGTCLAVITHLRILNYLVANYKEERQLFDHSIKELGVGTFAHGTNALVTIKLDAPLLDAFQILSEKGVSCIPVVDAESGILLDLYCKSYITCFSKKDL